MTSRRVVFRPQADAEAVEARRWYDERQPGLGEEFAIAVTETVAEILKNPRAFPPVRGETRRAILRRFPYAVYFRVVPDAIVLLAVLHGHRHPRLWQSRR